VHQEIHRCGWRSTKLRHCMAVVDELQMVLVRYHLHHLALRELLM
jgi:hypothetical protein